MPYFGHNIPSCAAVVCLLLGEITLAMQAIPHIILV